MAVSHKLYGLGMEKIAEASVDFLNDTVKVALVTSSYTFDQDTHDFWDDVSTNEVSGTGYTAGGETLGTKTVTYDAGTNEVRFDAADVTWTSSTITARYAVIYKDSGVAATSPLIALVDFGQDEVSSNGDFGITWAANSVFKITVAA
jgi:hypothetical protein